MMDCLLTNGQNFQMKKLELGSLVGISYLDNVWAPMLGAWHDMDFDLVVSRMMAIILMYGSIGNAVIIGSDVITKEIRSPRGNTRLAYHWLNNV